MISKEKESFMTRGGKTKNSNRIMAKTMISGLLLPANVAVGALV